MRRAAIVFLCLLLFPLTSRPGKSAPPTLTPLLTTVDLNVGESQQVELTNGKKILVQLLDLKEARDDLRHAVRRAEVRVAVAGQAVSLVAANYQLPVTVAGVQIDCAVTKGYCHRHFKGPWQQKAQGGEENPWGLAKDARLRLWPAGSPLMNPGTFVYPVKQRWFASATHMGNEPCHVDGGEEAGTGNIYYHYGLDIGGSEGMVEVVAATDGLVVSAGKAILPGYEDSPTQPRYDVIYLLDARGWYYRYSHLQSFHPEVRPGEKVKIGQPLGLMGKEGATSWSHLHFDISGRQPSGKWGIIEGYAFLWEAYQNEYRPDLLAVARPHHLAAVGQKVVLDGSRSWSANDKITAYQWTFTDGTTATGPTVERVYTKAGTYSEVLKVTDGAGRVAYDFATVNVLEKEHPEPLPPTIHANYAPTFAIRPGDPVTFKVRSFQVDIGNETWDFGDGSPPVKVRSDGNANRHAPDGYAVTVHRFAKPGDYLVRVEGTGRGGAKAVAYLHVRVEEKPPAPASGPARSLKDELPPLVPKEPAAARKTFQTLDGFRLDLIAHEPQVTSPVAVAYDEDGRLYAVEMRDYPDPPKPGTTPLGRIRLLEDRDGDGFYETSHIFAEGLPWPTGIACWDGGVYVTAAPDIWYFKGTKGDGKADVRRKVYTGFVAYNVQALVNGLQWGVDNRIYGVTAANGGAIQPVDQPEAKPISVRGRDFRFDPATGRFEAISGTAQFGNAFDDWYNRFVCANRLVTGHVVIASHYLARNPYVPLARVVQDCAAEGVDVPLPMFQISPAEPWRVVRTRRYLEEGQKQPLSEMVVKGIFTSGTGIAIYRGAAYPEKYRGNAFVGNPAGNLVHRRLLTPQGGTYVATRADREVEFIASTDNFFRPVNGLNAPDGTLHLIDMYREVVEHPWSLPDDIKSHLDLSSGRDRGRIYRLTPPGFQQPAPPRLGQASTRDLVATLENPNSWWRETAQRLLYQRQDKSAVPLLRQLARQSRFPLAQLHALGTLDGLGALEPADLAIALNSPVSGLREHGLRLAEPRLEDAPELAEKVLALSQDADTRVRFQTALTLGELAQVEAPAALARIARSDGNDPWLRLAVLSSSGEQADRLLDLLVQGRPEAFAATEPGLALLRALAAVIGARNRPWEMEHLLRVLADATGGSRLVQRELVLGLDEGLLRAGKTLESLKLAAGEPASRLLRELFAEAAKTAVNEQAPVPARTEAVQLLGRADAAVALPALRALLDPRQPQPVQLATVRAVRNSTFADVPGLLLERWSSYTPAVRAEVLAVLSVRPTWAAALLDAVASRKVLIADVDAPRRALLLKHRDAPVRARAVELFGDLSKTPRADIVSRYRPALELKRDATRGRAVFQRECASCHAGGGLGQNVGPAIASIGTRTPETLLISTLDPNREVDPRYLNYHLVTRDGRVLTGIIAAETDTAVVLRRADGASDTILRTQIEELNSTGQSLMPDGFEQKINFQEMADLLAFLLEAS